MSQEQTTPPHHDSAAQLERLHFALQAAQVGTWDLDISNQLVWWDERCKELYGFEEDGIVPYEEVLRYIHPDDQPRVAQAVELALNPLTGGRYDCQFRTLNPNGGKLRWLRCQGQAYFKDDNVAYRFSGIAQDITQAVRMDRKLEASQGRFRDLVLSSPTPTVVFSGRNMVVELINDAMVSVWGKDYAVLGKTLLHAMPELVGQPFLELLQQVFDTGEPFQNPEGRADLMVNGEVRTFWFNYSYSPLYDETGKIYGVINTATDVTEQVAGRIRLEEAEEVLRGAIELAELGTWQIDLRTRRVDYSPRVRYWTGIEPEEIITIERERNHVRDEDWLRVKAAFENAIAPQGSGLYDVEFTIEAFDDNPERIVHAVGNAFFDNEGNAYKIWGTMQDVTQQRQQQRAQEWLVQKRTEELAASNEELLVMVEELERTNDQLAYSNKQAQDLNHRLEEANSDLSRSNENLEQFAYVASHDLQEPLRKVQSLGTLLSERYAERLGEDGRQLLDRMTKAGKRMSSLIDDLLSFSRISTRRAKSEVVSLEEVVHDSLDNLSTLVKETGGHVRVSHLPVIDGDKSQLIQLFQNLISNALKFQRDDAAPLVLVRSSLVPGPKLPPQVKPVRHADMYHCISVKDDGIGFDEKYLDRIFQVFQRLHGRAEYAGTGIGLSICQKVVANHGGAITASSKPGEGATFYVYLPA